MVVMMVREGMAVVLSSDLTQCLGVPPRGMEEGSVLLQQLTRGLGNRAVTSLG